MNAQEMLVLAIEVVAFGYAGLIATNFGYGLWRLWSRTKAQMPEPDVEPVTAPAVEPVTAPEPVVEPAPVIEPVVEFVPEPAIEFVPDVAPAPALVEPPKKLKKAKKASSADWTLAKLRTECQKAGLQPKGDARKKKSWLDAWETA